MIVKSKKGRVFIVLIFFTSLIFNIFANDLAVIITHGSPGRKTGWHQPGGAFYEVLNGIVKQHGGSVEDFRWDQPVGGFTKFEILNGASHLAARILELHRQGKTVVIIAHSYGGYVVRAASQFLNPQSRDFVYVDHDSAGRAGGYDEEELHSIRMHFNALHREVWKSEKRSVVRETNYLIDFVFTLGTPNNVFDIHADAGVIKNFCNIYSNGDIVQEVVGDRKLPDGEDSNPRFVDVRVDSIEGYSRCGCCFCLPYLKKPSHEGLHNQIVAKWVLSIPEILIEAGIGEPKEDGIHFNSDAVMNLFLEDEPGVRADR